MGRMWYFTHQTKSETGWPTKPLPASPGTLQYVLLAIHSSPFHCSTKQGKLWTRISDKQELSMGQFTLFLRLVPSFSPSPAVPWQAAVSIQAGHLTVPHGGCLRCSVLWGVMGPGQRQTLRWVLHANFRAWLEKKSPSQYCFAPLLASPAIYTATPLTLQYWMWELPSDTSMITWQYYGVSHNFLSLLWTTWPCSTPAHNAPRSSQSGDDDRAAPALGRWVGRARFILLPSCPFSWSDSSFSPAKQLSWAAPVCMQKEGMWGILDPGNRQEEKKSWRWPSYALTWHCSVSYGVKIRGMKSTQQIRSALAFSPSGKGIKNF